MTVLKTKPCLYWIEITENNKNNETYP